QIDRGAMVSALDSRASCAYRDRPGPIDSTVRRNTGRVVFHRPRSHLSAVAVGLRGPLLSARCASCMSLRLAGRARLPDRHAASLEMAKPKRQTYDGNGHARIARRANRQWTGPTDWRRASEPSL